MAAEPKVLEWLSQFFNRDFDMKYLMQWQNFLG